MSTRNARELWRRFHDKDPREEIDYAEPNWPFQWGYSGEGLTVYYRSDKWSPDGKYTSYYHDHEGGVEIWEPKGAQEWIGELCEAPCSDLPCDSAAILGWCLGWDIECADGDARTVTFAEGKVYLCATPSGKALFALDKASGDVLAAWCGGSLGILPEGIVG